jgi:hypothetical protein
VRLLRWLFLLLFPLAANATTIFTSLGAGNSYDDTTGASVSGASSNTGSFAATGMAFTPSGNFLLGQIDTALNFWAGTNSVVLTLNTDSGGSPGSVLETWNLGTLPAIETCCTIETVTPTSPIFLNSGVQYWLVASPGAANTSVVWEANNLGLTGTEGQRIGNSAFNPIRATLSAFDVQGTSVPEPGTFGAEAAAIAFGSAALYRRLRRGVSR